MKKKILMIFTIIVIFGSIVCCVLFYPREINACNKYTSEYIKAFPKSKEIQTEIGMCTNKVINENPSFDWYLSTYIFRYIIDCYLFNFDGLSGKETVVDSYYNEIVILRLKYLLVNKCDKEFIELFSLHYNGFNNCWMTTDYLLNLLYDVNYPVEYGDEQYKIIELAYFNLLENSTSDMDKYFILDSLVAFYGNFDEAKESYQKYIEERKSLMDIIGQEQIEDEIYKRFPRISFD